MLTKTKTKSGDELLALLSSMATYYRAYNNPILNIIPSVVLRGLIRSDVKPEDFEDQAKMNEVLAYLDHYIKDHADNYGVTEAKNYEVSLKYNPENAKYAIELKLFENETEMITANLVKSNEFKRLKNSYPQIRDFLNEEEIKQLFQDFCENQYKTTCKQNDIGCLITHFSQFPCRYSTEDKSRNCKDKMKWPICLWWSHGPCD